MTDADAFSTIWDDPGKVVLSVKAPHGFPLSRVSGPQPMPDRRPIGGVPGGRRPTVAVLDTGVADHDWFESDSSDDPIRIDPATVAWPGPENPAPEYRWHGTFVAGLIRQTAPDARILSLQMTRHEGDVDGLDGIAEGEIRRGLRWLGEHTDSLPSFVDVVCLAIGYREEPEAGYTREVRQAIHELGRRGVVVVTAAGNRGERSGIDGRGTEDWAVFPAQLAKEDPPSDGLPVIAVGANTAAGTVASFSPAASWVRYRLVGEDVVSATPSGWSSRTGFSTSDPSGSYADGPAFGRGSGTSFAAARFAGWLAQAMLDDGGPGGGAGVADTGREAALRRARRAIAKAYATDLAAV
jgi:hypothetical protein